MNLQEKLVHEKYEIRISELIEKMTIEEKIGQLTQVGTSIYGGKEELRLDEVRAGKIGSFLAIIGAEKLNMIQRVAVEESRLKIPLLFAEDVIHGLKTVYPTPLAESCSFEPEIAKLTASAAAKEASANGIHWTFAPMVDICREPRWGRIIEGAGEDPYLGSVFASARVEGFQGTYIDEKGAINGSLFNEGKLMEDKVLACVKHFAAYGGAESGKDYNSVDMSETKLMDFYMPPFESAIKSGVATLMTGFHELNGEPCTQNSFLLKDILNVRYNFQGAVISDWGSITDSIFHKYCENKKDAAEKAIKLGVHIDMCAHSYEELVKSSKEEEDIYTQYINEAVRRVLRLKFLVGLFDNPYRSCKENEMEVSLSQELRNIAREAGRRSIVLLKNENQLLPLNAEKIDENGDRPREMMGEIGDRPQNTMEKLKIALVGELANSKEDMLGAWATKGDVESVVTILEAFKREKNVEVSYSTNCEIEEDSDVIVAVLGETSKMSGEAKCRGELGLPLDEQKLLEDLNSLGKPVILILINGRPLSLPFANEHINSIVEAWQLGTEAGNAISDVIFGRYNPSGKMTVTTAYSVSQLPIYYNHNPIGKGDNGNYGSNYIDIQKKPLYPFGYGLSYTKFKYDNLRIKDIKSSDHGTHNGSEDETLKQNMQNQIIKISVDVTNAGNYDGEEIVQLYVEDVFASRVRPVKELKNFKKVMIKTLETKEVELELETKNLGFYNKNLEYIVEKGSFKIYVGSNSIDLLETEILI